MARGNVRRVFPGGNTSKGFYSFYDHIISKDANKIFIIKGGPGVGKSTFMKHIAEAMVDRGLDAEYHHCSSDNSSLDGVVFPALDVAFIDGTAPHIVDPKNPGAVDEIIHLGDYWDEAGMRGNREPILRLNAEVGRLFRRAYAHLAVAKIFLDEYESAMAEPGVMDFAGLNRETMDLMDDIFDARTNTGASPRQRHLFATAITPEGPKNYLDTVVQGIPRRYVVIGEPGTGKTTIMNRIGETAAIRGYYAELFHCALDPSRIDHVVIPDLGAAVINGSSPHDFAPAPGDTVISTERYVNRTLLGRLAGETERAMRHYQNALDQAVDYLSRAKATHDEMETYYIPNMHFDQIARRREAVLGRVMELANERGFSVTV